jgi:cytoskeletal protein CcmA (bactofilin family)
MREGGERMETKNLETRKPETKNLEMKNLETKDFERRGELPNLTMSGYGKASGGEYGNVQIDGVTKVAGHLSALYGIRSSGVTTIEGNVYTPELRSEGKLSVEGALIARTTLLDGMCKVGGRIEADSVKLDGMLTAGGDIEAETFIGRGVVKSEGLLNAGTIELGLAHKASKIREIGGETVIVSRLGGSGWGWLWSWAMPSAESRLDAEVIEGDIVRLEYTHAAVVRGGQIVIGKGCRIGRAEFKTRMTVHPDSIVEKEEKLGE